MMNIILSERNNQNSPPLTSPYQSWLGIAVLASIQTWNTNENDQSELRASVLRVATNQS